MPEGRATYETPELLRLLRRLGHPKGLSGLHLGMSDFDAKARVLETRMRAGLDGWSDDDFDRLALEAFRHQFESCAPYRSYCERRGAGPGDVPDWRAVPPIPATAFKYFELRSAPGAPEAVFRTSGTTRGGAVRGAHHVPRLDLYRAACLGPLAHALLPDGARLRWLSAIPPWSAAPDSSLSFMVEAAAEEYAAGTRWLVDAGGGWSSPPADAFAEARAGDEPVVLLGTALALAHLIDDLPAAALRLPAGSRVMETGGFKGVRRDVSREGLYRALADATGVAVDHIVNEYGMTELLSQLWEPVLTEGAALAGVHVAPPWLRVRALDPMTLEPVAEGDDGILAFFDLANLGSICHVVTEDVGSVIDGRVRLRGRAHGAEPRGCSRAMDDLMSAAGAR